MNQFVTLEQIDRAVEAVRSRTSHRPRIGIVLGSGLNSLADSVQKADAIPFGDLPDWPRSTVHGHAGKLVVGELEGQSVMVMQGRVHFYEGYSISQVTLPTRVMARMGLEILIVTNAAGGVNPDFAPGDVMLITDHLNLMGMTGANPLMGPNIEELGPRFPDMSQAYDLQLMAQARKTAVESGITLREGVYCGLSGPSFEGPADLRFLRLAGTDAVGMSTVPEVIVARHGGMRVLGFSGISNKANLDGSTVTTHEEVIEAGKVITPKIEQIIRGVLRAL
ncbi:MAG TPA: purine-nucleoside phosphorylase [Anaerolineales bacterium]|nr:purine-nucleoside phosphorylase [Anaerolineales bacterium]HNQ93930.1 purine-nucleoside phosphorylase [Anaerolineales bacterium]HNS61092.1 purine-nucleoside phosphorylase [Anaerolineales bacterium]